MYAVVGTTLVSAADAWNLFIEGLVAARAHISSLVDVGKDRMNIPRPQNFDKMM